MPFGFGPPGCAPFGPLLPLGEARPVGANPYRPGGRVLSASGDRITFASTARLSDLTKNGAFTVICVNRRTGTGGNRNLVVKSSATTTRGYTFIEDNITVDGQLRFITGGASFGDMQASAANACPINEHEIVAATLNGTTVKLYRAAFATGKIAEVTAYASTTAPATPGTDSGDVLTIGNNNGASLPWAGDYSWCVEYATVLDADGLLKAQTALLMFEAGDAQRAINALRALGDCRLAARIFVDGGVTDFSPDANRAVVTNTTSAGATVNNDNTGASLNLVFSLTQFEDDGEGADGLDNREQTWYRYTSGFAQATYQGAATSAHLFGYKTFVATTYAAQQGLGVFVDGAYQGQVLSARTTVGPFDGTLSGMPGSAKLVQIVNGPRSRAAAPPLQTEPQEGTFASVVVFDAAMSYVPPPTRTAKVRVWSDSIGEGFVGDPIFSNAAFQQFRRALPSYHDSLEHIGFGGAMLAPATADATTQTALVRKMVAGNPTRLVIQIGANDRINSTIDAATFQTRLASLVDEVLARADFTGRILLISPTITSSGSGLEGANGLGSTMDDYRAAIATVQSTRTTRVDYMNGKTSASVGNLAADGAHLLNAGEAEYYSALVSALSPPGQYHLVASRGLFALAGNNAGLIYAGLQSAVQLASGTGKAETATSTSAIGTATALAVKMRVKGDLFTNGGGYQKILQIDESTSSNRKWVIGFRSETGTVAGIVSWDTTDGSFSVRQIGALDLTAFDSTKYYVIYVHYDPSSATEKMRAVITLDEAPYTVVLDGSSGAITGALLNGSTMGNVRVHRAYDGIPSNTLTIDGIALYSAILASGSARSSVPLSSDTNLLGYWPINEQSGTTANEINGGQALTLTGATWLSEGGWPTTGGSTYTLAASKGTVSEVGNTAALVVARRLTGSLGTFAVNGTVTGINEAHRLVAALGTFTEAGNAATLVPARRFTLALGTFAVNGTVTGINEAHRLVAAPGAYSELGNTVVLRLARAIAASTGVLQVNGITIGILEAHRLAAALGTFTETGIAAALRVGLRLVASPGALSINGITIAIEEAHRLLASAGAFTETGVAATLARSRLLGAAPGSLAVNGITIGIEEAHRLFASVGGFLETGNAATLRAARVVTLDRGVFQINGSPTAVAKGLRMPANPGTFAELGNAAAFLRALRFVASPGLVNVNGVTIGIDEAHRLVADAGALALAGMDAGFLYSRAVLASGGVFVLVGNAAILLVPDLADQALTGHVLLEALYDGRVELGALLGGDVSAIVRLGGRVIISPD